MGVYTPNILPIPNSIDELGRYRGLIRIVGESISDFRKRILLETRDPSGPLETDIMRTLSRKVGLFDKVIFELDLAKDVDGIPLAPDPFVEITSTCIRLWSDKDNDVLDGEFFFKDYKFLTDLKTEIDLLTNFQLIVVETNYHYLYSRNLMITSSLKTVDGFPLNSSYQTDLKVKYLKDFRSENFFIFGKEVLSISSLVDPGDYYVDKLNGIIYTTEVQSGTASFSYNQFPMRIKWQEIKSYQYNEKDLDYEIKKQDIIETGEVKPTVVNSEGAFIANEVIKAHGLTWGR